MAEEVRGGGEPSLWKVEGCEESTMMRSWTLVTAKPWGQRILIPRFPVSDSASTKSSNIKWGKKVRPFPYEVNHVEADVSELLNARVEKETRTSHMQQGQSVGPLKGKKAKAPKHD
jgi:hypothetical protein